MSREVEAVTYLLADATLLGLLTGGIYADSQLTLAGITNSTQTPKVWTGGTFHACLVVRARAEVPQFRVYDPVTRTVDTDQVLEHYIYLPNAAGVEASAAAISARLYTLQQEHRYTNAFGAQYQPGLQLMDAPNLIEVKMRRDDYRVVSIRAAA